VFPMEVVNNFFQLNITTPPNFHITAIITQSVQPRLPLITLCCHDDAQRFAARRWPRTDPKYENCLEFV
jgi:hypothetical protein